MLYKNAIDCLNELTSGKLDFAFHDPIFGLAQQQEGRLRLLAVSSREAAAVCARDSVDDRVWRPDGFESLVGRDGAGRNAKPIYDKINAMFKQIIEMEDTRNSLLSLVPIQCCAPPEGAQAMFLKAIPEWAAYVKLANIPQT